MARRVGLPLGLWFLGLSARGAGAVGWGAAADPEFHVGDAVAVDGEQGFVRSGPDESGRYRVSLPGEGLISQPLPTSALQVPSAATSKFLPGDIVKVGSRSGYVLCQPVGGKYLVQLGVRHFDVDFVAEDALELDTGFHLGDETYIEGDFCVVQSCSGRTQYCAVAFLGEEIPLDAIVSDMGNFSAPDFRIGDRVLFERSNLTAPPVFAEIIYGPHRKWQYWVRLETGRIVGPLRGSRPPILDDSVVGVVRHECSAGEEEVARAHAVAERGSVGDFDWGVWSAAKRAAAEAAQRAVERGHGPAAAGSAACQAVQRLGLTGSEVAFVAVDAAIVAAAAADRDAPSPEVAVAASRAAIAAGIPCARSLVAHIDHIAEAVARAGATPSEAASATLSAALAIGSPRTQAAAQAAEAAAASVARRSYADGGSPALVGEQALKAASSVGVPKAEAVSQASRAAVRAVVEGALRGGGAGDGVAAVAEEAAAAAGVPKEHLPSLLVTCVAEAASDVAAAMGRPPEEIGKVTRASVAGINADSALKASAASGAAAWAAANASASLGRPESRVASAAKAAAWAADEFGVGVVRIAADAAARAVADHTAAAGAEPATIAKRAHAAALAAGAAAGEATSLAMQTSVPVLARDLLRQGATPQEVAAAVREAVGEIRPADSGHPAAGRAAARLLAEAVVTWLLRTGAGAQRAGQIARLAIDELGLPPQEAARIAADGAFAAGLRRAVLEGLEPMDTALWMRVAARACGVPSESIACFAAAAAARAAAERAAAGALSPAQIGDAAEAAAMATDVPFGEAVAMAAAAAAATAAAAAARNDAQAAGIAKAAADAALAAGMERQQVPVIAASAAAATAAWLAAERDKSWAEVGSAARAAVNASGLPSSSQALRLACDAAAQVAVAASTVLHADGDHAAAATAAVVAAGAPKSWALAAAARGVASAAAVQVAVAGWQPVQAGALAASRAERVFGTLPEDARHEVVLAAASAVAYQAPQYGMSQLAMPALAKFAAFGAGGSDEEVEEAGKLMQEVLSRAGSKSVSAAAEACRAAARGAAAAGSPPAEVTFAAVSAAQAAGMSEDEAAYLAAKEASVAVSEALAEAGSTPEEVGSAAGAALEATGLSQREVDAAGSPIAEASAAAVEAAARAVAARRIGAGGGEELAEAANGAVAAARAAGASDAEALLAGARIVALLAAEAAAKGGKSAEEVRRAAERAVLAAGAPFDELSAAIDAAAAGAFLPSESGMLEVSAGSVAAEAMRLARAPWAESEPAPELVGRLAHMSTATFSTTRPPRPRATTTAVSEVLHRSRRPPRGGRGPGFALAVFGAVAAVAGMLLLLGYTALGTELTNRTGRSSRVLRFCKNEKCVAYSTLEQGQAVSAFEFHAEERVAGPRHAIVVLEKVPVERGATVGGGVAAGGARGAGGAGKNLRPAAFVSVGAAGAKRLPEGPAVLRSTHACLLALQRHPLNRAGRLVVYLHSEGNVLLEVHHKFPVPDTLAGFVRLMSDVLRKGQVVGDEGTRWLTIVPGPVQALFPAGCVSAALTLSGGEVPAEGMLTALLRQCNLQSDGIMQPVPSAKKAPKRPQPAGAGPAITFALAIGLSETSDATQELKFGAAYADLRVALRGSDVSPEAACEAICAQFVELWGLSSAGL